MNDEIKEILDKIKEIYDIHEQIIIKHNNAGEITFFLSIKEGKLLLDYITNLQEQLHQASLDIQELTERDIECPSWCDKLTNLQQENEESKPTIIDGSKIQLCGYKTSDQVDY